MENKKKSIFYPVKKPFKAQILIYLTYITAFVLFFWILANHWLPGEYIIAGHDSGLPLNTKEFLKTRFFAWDERIGFGQDNSALFGSIVLHSFDYLFAFLSGQTAAGNVLAVTFWLSLLFLSAFVFAISFKNVFGKYFVYLFPPLITINFYIFQSMFILERAKYELVSALLLFIALVFKLRNGQIGILIAAILTSLMFSILNGGGWIGLPLYGGIIVFTLTYLGLEFVTGILKFDFKPTMKLIGFLFLTAIFFLIINSYSILPYFITFKNADSILFSDGNLKQANIEWIGSLSHGASYLNLFRLQGVPDWFSNQYVLSPGHPFAESYFDDRRLVVLSFLLPILALLSFILAKNTTQKKHLNYFAIITLVGMLFTAGTHPPLGFIYEFIYNYVPGFIIFRSPYYKFGNLLFVGLAVLIAFSLAAFIENIEGKIKRRVLRESVVFVLVLSFIGSWLGFYFKLYDSSIFSWQKGFTSRVKAPEYINDFNKYASKNLSDGGILLFPPFDDDWKNDGYSWGYWSLSTLPYSMSGKNFIVNGFGLTKEENRWIDKLYSAMEAKREPDFLDISKRLNAKYLLLRKDATKFSDFPNKQMDFYEQLIDDLPSIKKIKSFDEWSLYSIDDISDTRFAIINSIALVSEKDSYLSREFLNNERVVLYGKESNIDENLEKFATLKAHSLDCNTCFLENYEVSNKLPDVTILPDSFLYRFKVYRENQEIEKAYNDSSKISSYLAFILRRTAEYFRMINFNAKEKFLKSDSDTINTYLDRIYELIKSSSDPSTDYTTALRIFSGISPVENNLKNYIQDREFLIREEDVRNSVIETMMKINQIKDYYQPLLKDVNQLRNEKRYLTNSFPVDASIFIRNATLPRDDNNLQINPVEITFQQGSEITKFIFNKQDNSEWTEVVFPPKEKSSNSKQKQGFVGLKFNSLPNLYSPVGFNLETTATGQKKCYLGTIRNFNSSKTYEVIITVKKKDQVLRLLFKNTGKDKEFGFLVGNPAVNIYPILTYEPFRYVYRPNDNVKNPNIYICSDDKEVPEFDKVEIFEISSPQLIIVNKKNDLLFKQPTIDIKKENSTKYIVNVKDAKDPFILSLNQRYSPLWRLSEGENNNNGLKQAITGEIEKNHIMIDGYANGWIIDRAGDYTLTIEYIPQKFFSIGYKITLIALMLSCTYLIIRFVDYIRRKKHA